MGNMNVFYTYLVMTFAASRRIAPPRVDAWRRALTSGMARVDCGM